MDQSYATQIPEGKIITLECPYCHMLMQVPYHRAGARATCESCQGITNFRFVGQSSPVTRTSGRESFMDNVLIVLGLVFIVGGIVLSIGNRSGAIPTFPFAGFITGAIGVAMLATAIQKGN